jgi:3-hydroxy acid dehydrogenase/malonic semialdehyde reductase
LVKQLVEDGHAVWGIARRGNLLEELKKELGNESQFFYSVCDVGIQDEVSKVVLEMRQKEFLPEAIILAAGVFSNDIADGLDYGLFKKMVEVNFYGSLNFVNAFLPYFLKQGYGQFVALSSITAFKPSLRGVGYPAGKAALGITFRGLDLAYRHRNIIFSTIYLGPVATEMWKAKKTFAVADKSRIARAIKYSLQTKRSVYYIPFWSTIISRLSFLPDKFYIILTELFR